MTLALFFVFSATVLLFYFTVPTLYQKSMELSQKRASKLSAKIDRVLPRRQVQKITQFYVLAPVIFAGILYVAMPEQLRFLGIVLGVIGGIVFPGVYNKILIAQNHKKFDDQLIDALLIMSSSFRGGLSLIQAMEAVVEEMPDPINQEFSIVLGENNMGVALDEALAHLYNRQPSSAIQQTITAILLARETGGNLPAIFQRIVGVIRETRRIRGQIETLTVQGKIQGVVMSLLPVAFFSVIYGSNPQFFDHMLKSQLGRVLLIYALGSEIVGAYMIWKISSFKDF